jgi:hypothetical protein
MSALNMAMNGNAYKMIEIKKVNGPVVPMAVPMSNLANLSEPLRPYEPLQNPQTQVTLKPSNPQTQQPRLYQQQVQHPQQHTDLNQASTLSHSASISHNSSYSPLSTSNGTVQRPVPPPPPSRDGTLSRVEAAPPRGERVGVVADGGRGGGQESTPPPLRPSEETNGVSTVSPQELDFYTKEDEKWWWVCCLEFCFCLL